MNNVMGESSGAFHGFVAEDSNKRTGTTIATVIGIAIALLVVVVLFNRYSSNRNHREDTASDLVEQLGQTRATTAIMTSNYSVVESRERQDAMKIAFMEGRDEACRHGYGYDHGHGRHDCGSRNEFLENRKFTEVSDDVSVITRCGC